MRGRWISIAVATAALALPGAAQAATISFSGGVLTYTAGAENNNVTFTLGSADYSCTARGAAPCVDVQELGADIAEPLPAECARDGMYTVECEVPSSIVANLGDGDDSLFDWDGPSTIDGGAGNEIVIKGYGGNDTIRGGPGNDGLLGGDGNDTLDGGDGDDSFEGFGGLNPESPNATGGTDVYIGGPGKDFVDYAGRTEPLTISLDGTAGDGAAGESDNVGADVEQVRGGNGADTITGNAAGNWLDGWDGNDTLDGQAGDDSLFGRNGDDGTSGGPGQDTIEGGDGSDVVDGGADVDKLHGDTVQICVPSDCDSGQDSIAARDGANDAVTCGPGTDSATLDAGDQIPASGDDVCEQVDRAAGGGDAGGGYDAGGGDAGADVVVPQLSGLRAGKLRRGRTTTVRYTLSEAATVTFKAQRRVKRRGKLRWVKLPGALRHSGRAGANALGFDGRLKGRRLKPGRYRLVAVARDAAGNQAPPQRARFRVVR